MFRVMNPIREYVKRKYFQIDFELRVKKPRNRWMSKNTHEQILNAGNLEPLTDSEKRELKDVWGKYANSEEFLLYKKHKKSNANISDYVPWEFYLNKLDPFYCKSIESRIIDNKNYYDLFFYDFLQPKTIVRYMNGEFLDEKYKLISKDEFIKRCIEQKNLIIKPALLSNGGSGIKFWNSGDSIENLIRSVECNDSTIVQEVISQHADMAKLHYKSINTLRLITFLCEGEVHIITSFIRMGRNNSLLDNSCSGGLFCGVLSNGILDSIAFDSVGHEYTQHPTSGIIFSGYKIPSYSECIQLVKRVAPRFSNIAKIIPWDIAIAGNGEPMIIETNFGWPDIVDGQITSGPLFGNNKLKDKIIYKFLK